MEQKQNFTLSITSVLWNSFNLNPLFRKCIPQSHPPSEIFHCNHNYIKAIIEILANIHLTTLMPVPTAHNDNTLSFYLFYYIKALQSLQNLYASTLYFLNGNTGKSFQNFFSNF